MDGTIFRRHKSASRAAHVVHFTSAFYITVRRSNTDPEAEGVTLYIGPQASDALQAIRPAH